MEVTSVPYYHTANLFGSLHLSLIYCEKGTYLLSSKLNEFKRKFRNTALLYSRGSSAQPTKLKVHKGSETYILTDFLMHGRVIV
jgi:hypothetical protein